jgi:hypothetical protein
MALGRASVQQGFDDPRVLLGDRLREGSLYRVLADHGQVMFPDDYFADLYAESAKGRPTVGAENLRHLGRCCGTPSARSCERCLEGGLVRACDDLRLVGLKLIFLIVTRAVSVLGLSRREAWWKDAEILMLRHQLAVALRERPRAHSRLTWPDRAWLALLAETLPGRALGRVAADRDSSNDFALAPRHCPPPVGAVVPPGTFRPAAGAP